MAAISAASRPAGVNGISLGSEVGVWYTYLDQPDHQHVGSTANPSQIARVLGDGSTQRFQFEYNTLGKTTKTIDPRDRVMRYIYDPLNDIDLLEVRQQTGTHNELVRRLTYGPPLQQALHLPRADTDASGETTWFTYNPHGQITEIENANNEKTVYTYSDGSIPDLPAGYLASITGPQFNGVSAVTSFTYDDFNRVERVRNEADQYDVITEYDRLDRKTKITYPDGTFEQFTYTDNDHPATMTLDLTGTRDRNGRWTYRRYNSNQQMVSIIDPANRETKYHWCACGSLESIEDPNHNFTTFLRDIQGRVYQKMFAAQPATAIHYLYEGQTGENTAGATSRLKSVTDARGQRTNYTYFKDDNIDSITYTDVSGNPLIPPTPSVSFTYDPNYNRVQTMTDGTGLTEYGYYPITDPLTLGAGRLQTVDGPLANDTITYTYDQLGRQIGQSINGVAQDIAFDSLGRVGSTDNALGHFDRSYDGVTTRLQTLSYPNGQTANYGYFGNTHDRRLQTILNLGAGVVSLSQFDYTYDSDGQILTWGGTSHTAPPLPYVPLSYDNAKQLTRVFRGSIVNEGDSGLQYDYDAAGNRLTNLDFDPFRIIGSTYTVNNLNQLTSVTRDTGNGPPVTTPLTYDAAGNMTYDGDKQTFEWDAANRLIAINYTDTGNRTEFAYDGLGRRVKITEYGAAVTAQVQPKSGEEFTPYSTKEFNLVTGDYVLMFTGINPNGGNNSALIDNVILNESLIRSGGFENPGLSVDTVAPSNSGWNFSSSAGIAAHGGDLMTGGPGAPEGDQAAFVTNMGALWQVGTVTPGTYSLSFQAAQAASGNDSNQRLGVTMRGTLSTKRFVWSGSTIAEERDAAGATVTKRFFAEGQQQIGGKSEGNYYYSRDHLGSIRELTDANGQLVAQYDYDAWGKPVVLSGNMTVDFGYSGHYFHQPSALNLALYRAYNSTMGRWINRDPAGEAAGLNLYAYVGNDPLNAIDALGLLSSDQCAALKELLRREQIYGTRRAAFMSGNTFGDRLLNPFNSTDVPNLQNTRVGELDLDWLTDLNSFSLGGRVNRLTTPGLYVDAKLFWSLSRWFGRWSIGNSLPFQDIGETHAVLANIRGLHYSDIFDDEYLERECSEDCPL